MSNRMLMRRACLAFVLFILMVIISCGDKIDPVGGIDDTDLPDQVTYGSHIRPLLEQNCTICHAENRQGADRQGAPVWVDLDSYDNAVTWAERSNSRIQAGTMPPSGELSGYDRSLFQKWVDQDLQE